MVIIDDVPLAQRLPKPQPNIIIPSSTYYMNNRQNFIEFINGLFNEYREEIEKSEDNVSCDDIYGSDNFSLLTHQKIVRDYINLYTPYRGILLYHGLGSGKTCSSIAIAEGMKSKNKILVLTPASLRTNYIEELKKCGDVLYKKNQYWEFIDIKSNPGYLDTLSEVLSLPKTFIQNNGGAWLVNVTKETNFDSLSNEQKTNLDMQLTEMINQKYEFINYNGLRRQRYNQMSKNNTFNIFSNKVVIIDEAHNLISRIVNKIDKRESLSVLLYEKLMEAENCRIIMLSGTPIINYPNEVGILFNILRGYIKTWNIPLQVKTTAKINKDELKKIFSKDRKLNNVIDFVNYSATSKMLVVTKNPFGFVNNYKDGNYGGVKVDDHGQVTDDNFKKMIIEILKKENIEIVDSKIKIEAHTALPDRLDPFKNYFINSDTGFLTNSDLFKRRILGLTSYFRSAQEKLMPAYTKENNFNVIKVPLSDYQFGVYEGARVEERKLEKQNKKKKKKQIDNAIFEDSASTYRIFSRLFCNFVFPKDIKRPTPKDEREDIKEDIKTSLRREISEEMIDAVPVEQMVENQDGLHELDDLEELKAEQQEKVSPVYLEKIMEALKLLEANSELYLSEEGLKMYSPKFLSMLQKVKDEKNLGLHLFYSQFRTIEGVGVFALVLKQNGFAQFKIKNVGDNWIVDISEEDRDKPKFVLYTGTETVEEKEILRRVFNNQWDDVPKQIKEYVSGISETNQMGEIIKVFMITASGAEGISLRNVRYVHICEPYWHPVRVQQVIGRAKRICSHESLPEELRTVDVFLYLMTFSKEQLDSDLSIELRLNDTSKLDSKQPLTSDEALFEISNIKEDITLQLMNAVKETSMDCSLHKGKDASLTCYSFGNPKPDNFFYVPSLSDDDVDKVSQMNKVKITWKARAVTINGKKYAINTNTMEVYDFESYLAKNPIKIGALKKNKAGKDELIRI